MILHKRSIKPSLHTKASQGLSTYLSVVDSNHYWPVYLLPNLPTPSIIASMLVYAMRDWVCIITILTLSLFLWIVMYVVWLELYNLSQYEMSLTFEILQLPHIRHIDLHFPLINTRKSDIYSTSYAWTMHMKYSLLSEVRISDVDVVTSIN